MTEDSGSMPGRSKDPSVIYSVQSDFHPDGIHWLRVPPGVQEDILEGTRKHLRSIKMKHKNLLNLEPALILALTKILSRAEVLACQKKKLNHLNNRSEPH
jgi:hypothetical protein